MTQGVEFDVDARGIGTLTFDFEGKVNVMNDAFMQAMEVLVPQVEARREALSGLILSSAKNTFFAGGDLALMGRSKPGMEAFLLEHFERLKGYFRRLEMLGVPMVAAINGTALGGGYELCLACHHRVAIDRPDARIGLPEVGFGILPAAGGVIRLTHLLGLENALEYLLTGRKVTPAEAHAEGLIDALAPDQPALLAAARAWIEANPAPVQPWDRPRAQGAHQLAPPQRQALLSAAAWMRRIAGPELSQAAVRITDVAVQSLYLPWDCASRIETRGFVELLMSDAAQRKIAAFFAPKA
ncbi:enoyl-CoA hydratase/isomerase family protein [Alcaligenaceae bacterium]|nr:enoyl-CoA hydratase/isomerase family protein [Alcaligenaceae bacterium]